MKKNNFKSQPKFEIGDTITYKDKYWGEIKGIVNLVGYQGNNVVYGLTTKDGAATVCLEKQILKSKSNKK